MNINKFPLVFALLFVVASSCKNSNSGDDVKESDDVITIEGDTRDPNNPEFEGSGVTKDRNIYNEDIDSTNNEDPGSGNNTSNPDRSVSNTTGKYIKTGEESDTNCHCYCVDLNTSGTQELCLVPGEMYISARLQKNSDNSIDVFLVEPSARNTQGKDMPWKDFDRNSAIAKITPQSKGSIDLDWLGFKINGDLAMDYALFGKKTLEGEYKLK
ncbi:hypothetical protein FK178_00360 [Antarcticibacterium arcticum]|uniref:Lipoprotein n=1 Tax=Antarcticibacterium arcticum TaxID=2585771 RepID=A0A5B8YIQ3_9FLAO|nr:hypothetical protein [Antarcticibacterium arcticum]QED36276.1 hypothetical protein FK178_00360 [Antarcticibacterium arcticum]